MLARSLSTICLSAALLSCVTAADAGMLDNSRKVAKLAVFAEKRILTTPLTAAERVRQQASLTKNATKCFVKAATKDPCF